MLVQWKFFEYSFAAGELKIKIAVANYQFLVQANQCWFLLLQKNDKWWLIRCSQHFYFLVRYFAKVSNVELSQI